MDVMVSFGEDDSVVERKLKKLGVTETDIYKYETDTNSGRCCSFINNDILIRLRSIPKTAQDYAYLQHEIFHAVTFVMYKAGIELVIKKSDEAYAYLVGYITYQILKRMN